MRRFLYFLVALATTLASGLLAAGGPASAAEPAFDIQELHFKVTVGPNNDQTCDIVGDLYVPKDASADNRMPAILSTNGFGGSKDDQGGLSAYAASNGYVALTYSGLGFGGSSCKIFLDNPDYDGKAASQLIDYLGGADGIAFEDAEHTKPVPAQDKVQLEGAETVQDPVVGMVGGSYGGEVQYAAASLTDKLDTIVPIITWNDLSYSLGPNNTDQFPLSGQERNGVSTRTPGAVKQNWALGFSAIGLSSDLSNQQPPADDLLPCPNFADFVCLALVTGASTGALTPAAVAELRKASVASYQDKVQIPTLILQGQADTLFNLNEAAATYEALQAQGTDVKMSWIEFGHSGPAAEGELDLDNPDPDKQHITKRVFDWFGHYLKRDGSSTGPEFSYFRDWVDYSGIATPAYAQSTKYPVGINSVYHLSSSPESSVTGGKLTTSRSTVTAGSQSFLAPPGPISTAEDVDVVSGFLKVPEDAETDAPGTFARYDTDRLSKLVDVVGSPKVRLQVEAPSAKLTQRMDAGKLVVYLKIVDVDESGKAKVVRNLAAPVRVPDVTKAFTVTMPAFVHRFESGHKIRLTVAGASPNYRGNTAVVPVTIKTEKNAKASAAEPLPAQSITLPTLGKAPVSGGGGQNGPKDPNGPKAPDGPNVPNGPNGPGGPNGSAGSGGNGAGNGANNGDTKGNGNGLATPRDAAQAGPTVTDVSSSSEPMPDTGGPPVGLLGAGLLLVVLGAHQLARRRRKGLS